MYEKKNQPTIKTFHWHNRKIFSETSVKISTTKYENYVFITQKPIKYLIF